MCNEENKSQPYPQPQDNYCTSCTIFFYSFVFVYVSVRESCVYKGYGIGILPLSSIFFQLNTFLLAFPKLLDDYPFIQIFV